MQFFIRHYSVHFTFHMRPSMIAMESIRHLGLARLFPEGKKWEILSSLTYWGYYLSSTIADRPADEQSTVLEVELVFRYSFYSDTGLQCVFRACSTTNVSMVEEIFKKTLNGASSKIFSFLMILITCVWTFLLSSFQSIANNEKSLSKRFLSLLLVWSWKNRSTDWVLIQLRWMTSNSNS